MLEPAVHQAACQAMRRRDLVQSAVAAVSGAAALTMLGAVWPAGAQAPAGSLPKAGSVLKLPEVVLLDASVWRGFDRRGHTLVVYWWASWCPFCALQSPHIEALWRKHQAAGLGVLALSIDKQPAVAAAYMAAKGYSFAAGMLTPEVARWLPKPPGLPVVVVLKINAQDGQSGQVVWAESGEMFPEDIEGLKKYI